MLENKPKYCVICGTSLKPYQITRGIQTCCRSCAMKKRYLDPKARETTSKAMKKAFEGSSELSQKWKQVQIDRYKNPNEHSKVSEGLKQYYKKHPERREKQSEAMKRVCSNAFYRTYLSNKVKQAHINDPNISIAKSNSQVERFKDYKERAKISEGVKKALHATGMHEKLSSAIKKNFETCKDSILEKQYNTKKANNSFNSSKAEHLAKEALYLVFNEVQHQYRSKDYPFNCDFYIPLLDLYIELNFHWTHGGRQFNENDNNCIEQLTQWEEKAKTSKFYQNAITTWTIRDIEKQNIAKQNNLNYLVFYRWNEFEQWCNNLKETT